MKKRNGMMAAGAFAILFTGFPHIWSIYQPYVLSETGWNESMVSICFYLPTLFFVVGNIFGGRIYDKGYERMTLGIGGIVFAGGIILSALTLGIHPVITYMTLGVMQGIGQGMIYAVVLATAQKWFPHKTGFASGVVITANGLCGFILSPVSKLLLERGGVRLTLVSVGFLVFLSAVCAVCFVRQPEVENIEAKEDQIYEGQQYTSAQMMRTKKFYYLVATMMCGLMPYYLVSPISQTIQIERGILQAVAVGSVMAGSILNAGIRLILPTLADRAGRITCIQGVLFVAMIAMLFLLSGNNRLITMAIILAYGCFGGIMGSFPSLSSEVFGLRYAGQNYGIIMSGIIIVTITSPVISNMILIHGLSEVVRFMTGFCFAVIALEYGFTSVMLDASRDSFEENIEKTKKVVELAAKYGATVEAELGLVGGSEDGKSDHGIRCTNPEDAKIFCEETGIDALAVAIGNAHGDYPVAPQLEFGVLEEIHNRTGIPLVLHGGSGITDADFQKAISLGIRKVNIATASFKSLTKEVENYLATEGAHNYFDMNEAMVLGTYKNVKHHIEVFNCK